MKYSIIFSIARTHLLTRKRQTIVAALGVTFGIASYVIMMGFMTGLNGLLDGMILNRTPHIHIYNELAPSKTQPIEKVSKYNEHKKIVRSVRPKRKQTRVRNANALMRELAALKEVKAVTPMVRAQGFYLAGSTQLSASLIGVDVIMESENYQLSDYIVGGKAENLATIDNGILLGIGAAKKMSVSAGDKIQVISPTGTIFQLKVVGFFQSGLADIDNIQSYVSLKTAQRIMGQSVNYITDINVKLKDMNLAPELSKDIEDNYEVNAVDIQTANAQFDTGSSIRTLISYAVSITLLIVAGFGIYNILNMLIYEKMNDIAILKATGFSGRDVERIFLSQAMIIGLLGGLLGVIVGYFISLLISRTPFETEALPTIKTYPVNFEPMYYVIAIIFALVSTFFAGYLPSRRAKRIDPVDIIRGQ